MNYVKKLRRAKTIWAVIGGNSWSLKAINLNADYFITNFTKFENKNKLLSYPYVYEVSNKTVNVGVI